MAENQESSATEPSMEEILASIRKIIADDKEPASAEAAAPAPVAESMDDILELTQMVQDDGSVVDLAPPPPPPPIEEEPAPPPAPEPEPEAPTAPVIEPVTFKSVVDDNLIADEVASAATSSLAALASTVQIERMAAMPAVTPIGNGSRTLEDMVMELMKPMLKQWLDQNLPATVERLVQKEVERIARRLQN